MTTPTDTCPAWDATRCDGTPRCPPRCPRFVDEQGDPMLVEPLTSTRLDDLVDVYDAYPERHRSMGLPPIGRERIETWLERLVERGTALVAVNDGRVVGHAAYAPSSSAEAHMVVFVDPAFHGRGIGTELCRHVVATAADAGHDALLLDVGGENERALSLYRRLGFETIDRSGNDFRMRLCFDDPIVERVQRPPALRSIEA
ncbi:N-acetyltransferase family protein [Natrarchaeobius sp. A-rgal3]|uniref:GNAT family N-acetyltransferase n=1 Tax=Natrarchaeobius versutus TaxID=1679078 RepID=UPI00350F24FA